jgi:diguanylate cyclase
VRGVDIDKDASESEQWKRKYFDQLEESESKEKQWRQADELLRKTISRLTLAADGQDKTLDRQLHELRNAIRDRASSAQLQNTVDAMSSTLMKLDRARKQQESTSTENSLLVLLDRLELPKGTGRKVKALRKKLDATQSGDQQVAIAGFVELIHAALELSAETDEATAGETAPRGGLLKRLFGAEEKRAPEEAVEDSPQVGELKSSSTRTAQTVREILIQLLERLSLPDDLIPQVNLIRDEIEVLAEGDSWDAILERIADLIQAIRTQTQKEKQGIEDFLLQLSERLQEVDRQLADSEQYYDDSFAAGEQLDNAVKSGINGIESDVREATDLTQIKQLVQTHIDTVLVHMEKHRAAEQHRYDKAKAEIAAMNGRLDELESETESLRSRMREERNQAQTDALTGIPNRLAYEERLEQEIARCRRFGTPLVLLMWDVDHFKQVNDNYGHKAGDKVLRTIARKLSGAIRETDFIARYGGEEFVHLMTGTGLQDCIAVADKLREMIEATGFHFRSEAVSITASCGLAQFGEDDSAESWFERADKALYKAKQTGRNRCIGE